MCIYENYTWCFSNHGEESVARALANVDHHYLSVGLYEDLAGYMEVLEYLMPHIFSNITQVYTEICKSKFSSNMHVNISLNNFVNFDSNMLQWG